MSTFQTTKPHRLPLASMNSSAAPATEKAARKRPKGEKTHSGMLMRQDLVKKLRITGPTKKQLKRTGGQRGS
jgi:hypothetical protein